MNKYLVILKMILFISPTFAQNSGKAKKPEKIKWSQLHKEDPVKTRAYVDYITAKKKPTAVGKVIDTTVVSNNVNIPVRLYYPLSGGKNLPMVAHYHGGGFTVGSINSSDDFCRKISNGSNVIVMSVEYRLAPEHKYPAGEDDCYDATMWLFAHAHELGGNPDRVALGGGSSGGYMTFTTAHRLLSEGKKLSALFAENPVMDHYVNWPEYESWNKYKPVFGFDFREIMTWFWDNYVTDTSQANIVSPLRQTLPEEIPSTLIFVGKKDPLRGEGMAYVEKLKKIKMKARWTMYSKTHGFLEKSRKPQKELFEFLKKELNK